LSISLERASGSDKIRIRHSSAAD